MNKLVPTLLACGFVCLASAGVATAAPLTQLWSVEGFAEPESVVVDASHNRLIVSNIDGHPGQADGKGFLSLVTRDGQLTNLKWVSGLDAPKGMAIHDGMLYVSDITRLHVVDLDRGELIESHEPVSARFLNDVTVTDGGEVFVTDMMANAVYRLRDGHFVRWSQDHRLHHPNGILAQDGRLIVGNWGRGLQADFTTKEPGALLAMELADRRVRTLPNGDALGNIDGIAAVGGYLVVSDWIEGTLRLLPRGPGEPGEVLTYPLEPGVADIGGTDEYLYVPLMHSGEVAAYRVSPRSRALE